MENDTLKRNAKDLVFRNLFSDKKYLLQLYRDLHPEDEKVTEDDITIVTLKRSQTGGIYNDLGFMVGNRLIMVESQSTMTNDLSFRMLQYLLETYKQLGKSFKENQDGRKEIELPETELYIAYVGDPKKVKEELYLPRIDFNMEQQDLLHGGKEIKVISPNSPKDKDTILDQYISFCKILDEQREKHGDTITALENTISNCKNNNILKEYLESNKEELTESLRSEFKQEKIGGDCGKKFIERGKIEEARETARNMMKDNFSIEQISKYVKILSMDDLNQIKAEIDAEKNIIKQ